MTLWAAVTVLDDTGAPLRSSSAIYCAAAGVFLPAAASRNRTVTVPGPAVTAGAGSAGT